MRPSLHLLLCLFIPLLSYAGDSRFTFPIARSTECKALLKYGMDAMEEGVSSYNNPQQVDARRWIARAHLLSAQQHNQRITHLWGTRNAYFVYPMQEHFIGEHCPDCQLVERGLQHGVHYFNEEQIRPHIISIHRSLVGTLQILKNGTLLDTSAEDFVLLGNGLLLSLPGVTGINHHSSLSEGSPIAAAGRWTVRDGVLEKITTQTRHYHDLTGFFILQMLIHLENQGVDLSDVELDFQFPTQPLMGYLSILGIPASWPNWWAMKNARRWIKEEKKSPLPNQPPQRQTIPYW